jgi:hypothetical protein
MNVERLCYPIDALLKEQYYYINETYGKNASGKHGIELEKIVKLLLSSEWLQRILPGIKPIKS